MTNGIFLILRSVLAQRWPPFANAPSPIASLSRPNSWSFLSVIARPTAPSAGPLSVALSIPYPSTPASAVSPSPTALPFGHRIPSVPGHDVVGLVFPQSFPAVPPEILSVPSTIPAAAFSSPHWPDSGPIPCAAPGLAPTAAAPPRYPVSRSIPPTAGPRAATPTVCGAASNTQANCSTDTPSTSAPASRAWPAKVASYRARVTIDLRIWGFV
jgi:hypothetical protein